jgi:uncharacterized protein YraI
MKSVTNLHSLPQEIAAPKASKDIVEQLGPSTKDWPATVTIAEVETTNYHYCRAGKLAAVVTVSSRATADMALVSLWTMS